MKRSDRKCVLCEKPIVIPEDGDHYSLWRRHGHCMGFFPKKRDTDVAGDFGQFRSFSHHGSPADLSDVPKVICMKCAQEFIFEVEASALCNGGMTLKTLDEAF